MPTISTTYQEKWRLRNNHQYTFDANGNCFRLDRKLRKVVKNGMIGYCIRGKFVTLPNIRKDLERIPQIDCPF